MTQAPDSETVRGPGAPPAAGRRRLLDRVRPAGLPAAAAALVTACSLAVLCWAAVLGRQVRPSGDEWCFLSTWKDGGAGSIVSLFYNVQNGRVFNALVVEAYMAPGVLGHQLFPVVSIAVVLGVLWGTARAVWRTAGLGGPRGLPLCAASLTAVLFLLATPNTYQTLYWPGSNDSHTLPPVLVCAAVWAGLAAHTPGRRRAAGAATLVLGACVALSAEETTVVFAVLLAAVLVYARLGLSGPARTRATAWAVCGLAGVAVGGAVLVTSPGLTKRRDRFDQGASPVSPDSLWTALHDWLITLGRILTSWHYVAALALGAAIGLLASRASAPALGRIRARYAVPVSAALFLMCGFGATILVRPAFGVWTTSSVRIRNDYLLALLLLLEVYGFLAGRALGRRSGARARSPLLPCAALAVCAVAAVSLAPPLVPLGREMGVRAEQWDRQAAWIHRHAAEGATTLPYKPLPIGGLREPFQLKGRADWAGHCAAHYFGVDSITPSSTLP